MLKRPKAKPKRAPENDSTAPKTTAVPAKQLMTTKPAFVRPLTPPPQGLITSAFPTAKLPPVESASGVEIPQVPADDGLDDDDDELLLAVVETASGVENPRVLEDGRLDDAAQVFEDLVRPSEMVVVKAVSKSESAQAVPKSAPAVPKGSFAVSAPTWSASQAPPNWAVRLQKLQSIKRAANNPILLEMMREAGLVLPPHRKGTFATKEHYYAYLDGAIRVALHEVTISQDNIGHSRYSITESNVRTASASAEMEIDERSPSRASTSSHASNKRTHSPDPGRA